MFARLALPAVLAGIAFTPAAQAQAPPAGCLQPKEIARRLSDQFAERPVAYGMQANGTLMQIFAAEDGSTYNEGYIWQDGKWYSAVATKIPWLTELTGEQDTSLELESELGVTRIAGVGCLNTFKVGSEGELAGFALNQGGTKYSWDGQSAYGMIERSTWLNKVGS